MVAKIESFSDGFNTMDTSAWLYADEATVVNGQLVITVGPTFNFPQINTFATYDLTESQMVVEVVQALTDSSTWFYVQGGQGSLDYTGFAFITDGRNELRFVEYFASVGTEDRTAITYNPVMHRWLRLREVHGFLYWDTSPDGRSWTTQRTKAAGRVYDHEIPSLYADGSAGTAVFDNYNLAPATGTAAYLGGVRQEATNAAGRPMSTNVGTGQRVQ